MRVSTRFMLGMLLVACIGMAMVWTVRAGDGDPDPEFGIVRTDVDEVDVTAGLVSQADGKLVLAGSSWWPNQRPSVFVLSRYTSDGRPDVSFGSGGVVTNSFRSKASILSAVALQTDGRIVAVGQIEGANSIYTDLGLARYMADGELDATFGTGGLITTDLGRDMRDSPAALAIQSDGKIIVVGVQWNGMSFYNMFIARYTSDGQLDTSFGTGGLADPQLDAPDTRATAITMQADGKIVVGGSVTPEGAEAPQMALLRFTATGSLDGSFGTGGQVISEAGPTTVGDVGIQADGRIVVVGTNEAPDVALARYMPDGTLDTSFGGSGVVSTDLRAAPSATEFASDLVIQPDGKLLVAGTVGTYTARYNYSQVALLRYQATGELDRSFGHCGMTTSQAIGRRAESGAGLVRQADGKAVVAVAGIDVDDFSARGDFYLLRYLNDGPSQNCLPRAWLPLIIRGSQP
jgi:uncharacterized delta-60 repeat protein